MSGITLALQLVSVAISILQRQEIHNRAAARETWDNKYDYVIVGAGTAGCTLAARLSENGQNSVLLLEAGGAATVLSDFPGAVPENMPGNIWGYQTTSQTHAAQTFLNQRAQMLRGKVIGGTSMINGMVVNRGNPRDFDEWANVYGAGSQWNYKSLLPYFKKIETYYNQSHTPNTEAYHGFDGPIGVSYPKNPDPIHLRFLDAWYDAGYDHPDYNGPTQTGAGLWPMFVDPRTWLRQSAAHKYLYPAIERKNLHVVAHAHVTQVVIQDKRATGVLFARKGQMYEVKAQREVILSAGAVNSPQILMLSGIGPRSELEKHGICLIADLPVGENLQDHTTLPIIYTAKNSSLIGWSQNRERYFYPDSLYQYYYQNDGPLTQRAAAGAFFSSPTNNNPDWPDICMFVHVGDSLPIGDGNCGQGFQDPQAWCDYFKPLAGDVRVFDVSVGVFRIHSRGYIRLASNNPMEHPLINPAFLVDQRDFEAQVDGLQETLKVLDRPYFREYATLYQTPIPKCESQTCGANVHMKDCRKYLNCLVRERATTSVHLTSSVPMGTKSNFAVVDPELRVHGIKNLRVIDASVMPTALNGNTNAATFVIAEKGADMVLRDRAKISSDGAGSSRKKFKPWLKE